MQLISRTLFALLISLTVYHATFAATPDPKKQNAFQSDWKNQNDRIWIGPEYWANPMEDWQLKEGRLECTPRAT